MLTGSTLKTKTLEGRIFEENALILKFRVQEASREALNRRRALIRERAHIRLNMVYKLRFFLSSIIGIRKTRSCALFAKHAFLWFTDGRFKTNYIRCLLHDISIYFYFMPDLEKMIAFLVNRNRISVVSQRSEWSLYCVACKTLLLSDIACLLHANVIMRTGGKMLARREVTLRWTRISYERRRSNIPSCFVLSRPKLRAGPFVEYQKTNCKIQL